MIYRFIQSSLEHYAWHDIRQSNDIVCIIDRIESVPDEWYRMIDINKSVNITSSVIKWMKENKIEYPFISKEDEVLFLLTFG